MSNANSHDIQVLNGLIQSVIDSAEGYAEAGVGADSPDHAAFFVRRENERRALAQALSDHVRLLGGDPQTSGSILAKAQRALTDVKHALLRDEAAMVGGADHADAALRGRFEKAVADMAISATTRETVRRAFASLKGDAEEISALRHNLESRHDADNPLFPQ